MKNKIILLVDDDQDDQLIFSDALNDIGEDVRFVTVNNGKEALVYLKKMPEPALIFLDLNMPVMNGLDFLKIIKTDLHFSRIPVVIYTTSDHPRDIKETMAYGASLFFTKTSDFEILKTRLVEIFESHFLIKYSFQPDGSHGEED
jgi:CheY-like chemotaxis protein